MKLAVFATALASSLSWPASAYYDPCRPYGHFKYENVKCIPLQSSEQPFEQRSEAAPQAPSVLNCPEFKALETRIWRSCMHALKDSFTVDSSDRDGVCSDIEFDVAFDLMQESGWPICKK
jgi:hypothetical protein